MAKTAITPTREDNFPEWYQQVIVAADMAQNSPVRGCMVIKPFGFGIWEQIQRGLDKRIKEEGVENAYFPLLISLSFMSKEAEHVDGFATECAVVTHHRLEKDAENGGLKPAGPLAEPYIIRPTSEVIIGEVVKDWIQSYRDLPLKINQWCNVMRWEMRTRLFLRTAEFLWQEGHNVFATEQEAYDDSRRMLEVYADFAENELAIPVIRGEKTDDERFPGAKNTFTIEAMMQDGKALQAGTSHYLGQTFSKSANIQFQNVSGQMEHAYTTSWGMSTRIIGGLIMTHGDDDGLRVPPYVAPYQVVVIPLLKDDANDAAILDSCSALEKKLKAQGVRTFVDRKDVRFSDKIWGWIKKGVPVRVEIGAREAESGIVTVIRRDTGKDGKETITSDELCAKIGGIFAEIHQNMFEQAKKLRDSRIFDVKTVQEVIDFFKNDKNVGFVKMPSALLTDEAFMKARKDFSITPRCKPLADNGEFVLVGKSY